MTEWIRFWITAVLLIIGLISFAAAVIGNYRFGYILNRVHAGGIGDTQGLFFIVLALIVSCNADKELWDHVDWFKVRSHPESEEVQKQL